MTAAKVLERLAGMIRRQDADAAANREDNQDLFLQAAHDTADKGWDDKVAARGIAEPMANPDFSRL